MRIISWNINGLLSCIKNHSFLPVELLKPDVICCQETRTNQQPEAIKGYHHYWTQTYGSHYGGLLTMSKEPASRIWYGVDVQKIDEEHRILVTEFSQAIVVNCYAPRMGEKLSRVDFRKEWDEALMGMVLRLQTLGKPVIVCGDMNVARLDIDMYQSERNRYEQEGFLTAAQSDVETFLDQGYVDAFREKHPTQKDSYTWWSSRFAKRSSGEGIRLDYIFIPTQIAGKIEDVRHLEKSWDRIIAPWRLTFPLRRSPKISLANGRRWTLMRRKLPCTIIRKESRRLSSGVIWHRFAISRSK